MSDLENHAEATNRPDKNRPTRDYEVGYCKPPLGHRFKHGNKANPKGRRKGSKSRKVVIHDVMFEPVTLREGDRTRQISALEAVLKKTLSKALAGDNKAALTIIGIAQKEGILTPEQEQAVDDLSETDLAIMQDVKRRLEAAVPELSAEHEARLVADAISVGEPHRE
jgi:Family of unknown function (DUF5681)